MSTISEGDSRFLKQAMSYFRVPELMVDFSSSMAKWPDIWCIPYEMPPVIVVTQEWKRQPAMERRKRLVHEILHLKGLRHGRRGRLDYNTIPEKDTYSMMVYQNIQVRSKR